MATGVDAYARSLAYLVLRALVGQLSGEDQLAIAKRILKTVSVKSLQNIGDLEDDLNLVSSLA